MRYMAGGQVRAERVGVGVDLVEVENCGVRDVLEWAELQAALFPPYGGG
jgi:hypothetical protein